MARATVTSTAALRAEGLISNSANPFANSERKRSRFNALISSRTGTLSFSVRCFIRFTTFCILLKFFSLPFPLRRPPSGVSAGPPAVSLVTSVYTRNRHARSLRSSAAADALFATASASTEALGTATERGGGAPEGLGLLLVVAILSLALCTRPGPRHAPESPSTRPSSKRKADRSPGFNGREIAEVQARLPLLLGVRISPGGPPQQCQREPPCKALT